MVGIAWLGHELDEESPVKQVVSRDSTAMAFDRTGDGPVLIVVDGARYQALAVQDHGPADDSLAPAMVEWFKG